MNSFATDSVKHATRRALFLALVAALLFGSSTRAQLSSRRPAETEPTTGATQVSSQPEPVTAEPLATASAPAVVPNPLRTPARMMRFFYAALEDGRIQSALDCLNFSEVDPEVASEHEQEYLAKLTDVLERLGVEGHFDPARLPDDPTAPPQTIGKDPVLLVLERYEYEPEPEVGEKPAEGGKRRRWQFSASTVADIPALYARLNATTVQEQAAPAAQPAPPDEQPPPAETADDPLRSPYHMVQQFFIAVASAKKDTAAYTDAMNCMDFSAVATADVAVRAQYVDDLAAVLEYLRGIGEFDRETLPQEPGPDVETLTISRDPLQLILVRQADGRWRFAARSVQRIPAMMAALKKIAQAEAEARPAGVPVTMAPPTLRFDTSSAQGTMNVFLTAMSQDDLAGAVACLDLSALPETDHDLARILAGKLWMTLNRYKLIVLQDIPADPEWPVPYSVLKHTAGRIEIDRLRSGPHAGQWLFTSATVRSIERLYEAFERLPLVPEARKARLHFLSLPSLWVREYAVPTWGKEPLWGLQLWQVCGAMLVALCGLAVRRMCAWLMPRIGQRLLRTETSSVLPQVAARALRPTAILAMLVTWWAGLQLLDLSTATMGWIWRGLEIALAVAAVVASYRLIDLFMAHATARAAQRSARLDQVLVPLLQKTIKVLIVALGLVLIAKTLGFQVAPLLAGLGLGGLAFGLAAQDTLKNFFGLVNIVLDRPFQVGDWIKVGELEGTLESVGLRSSRIRTGSDSEVTVPNTELMNARIENLGRRRYRRLACTLSVTYATPPEKLEAFCAGVRELIRLHPCARRENYQVYVSALAASSIDILVNCFLQAPDWGTELAERQRLLLDIIRLAQRLGVEFAYPTQTVFVQRENGAPPPPAPGRTRAVTGAAEAAQLGTREAAAIVQASLEHLAEKPPTTH